MAEIAFTFTGNAAVVNDYRYRGISQTRFKPALQIGADLAPPVEHMLALGQRTLSG
jgi:hypothetical protein